MGLISQVRWTFLFLPLQHCEAAYLFLPSELFLLWPYQLLTLLLAVAAQRERKVMNSQKYVKHALCIAIGFTLQLGQCSLSACHRYSCPNQFGHWSCPSLNFTGWLGRTNSWPLCPEIHKRLQGWKKFQQFRLNSSYDYKIVYAVSEVSMLLPTDSKNSKIIKY